MRDNEIVKAKIEALFRAHSWTGAIPLEEAVADALAYRANLLPPDRDAFDEQIMAGIHPYRAIEAIELMSGRLKSRMERQQHPILR